MRLDDQHSERRGDSTEREEPSSTANAEFRAEVRGADARNQQLCSQANEGMWGMPGHTEAMKAVVSCDKPGGAAHTH